VEYAIPYRNARPTQPADLVLSGDLDISQTEQIDAAVCDLIPRRSRTISVDLSEVRFMDCAGINTLLRAHAAAVTAGGKLELIAVSYAAWETLIRGSAVRRYPDGALHLPAADAESPQPQSPS
jgi:anti-anti-sigma factor